MGLLETILKTNDGAAVREAARQTGLSEKQAFEGLINLIPSLSEGVKKNTGNQQGLESLINALGSGKHERYLDQAGNVNPDDYIKDGNDILGHILGNKDASRQVAATAAKKSGLSSSILKKLLPIAAGLFMASLSKNSRSKNMFGQEKVTSSNAGILSKGLTMFLDSDNDGSVVDDLLGMAAKMFF